MALEITWPRTDAPTPLGNSIVASGWADETIIGVTGEYRSVSTSDSAPWLKCSRVGYFAGERVDGEPLRYRWALVFKVPGLGKYVLTVTGLRTDGKTDPKTASVEFSVVAGLEERRVVASEGGGGALNNPILGLATIGYPTSYQDITAEASNLFAYGDLYGYPLSVLELKDSNSNVIEPTSQDSDYEILQYWNASYPPLAPGLYSLRVRDANGNGDLAIDIYVGP